MSAIFSGPGRVPKRSKKGPSDQKIVLQFWYLLMVGIMKILCPQFFPGREGSQNGPKRDHRTKKFFFSFDIYLKISVRNFLDTGKGLKTVQKWRTLFFIIPKIRGYQNLKKSFGPAVSFWTVLGPFPARKKLQTLIFIFSNIMVEDTKTKRFFWSDGPS